MSNVKIELGDEIKDKISGYQGTVVAITEYLNGCRRVCICPKVGEDGAFRNERTFDEPQFEMVQKGAYKIPVIDEPTKKGGVARDIPRTNSI